LQARRPLTGTTILATLVELFTHAYMRVALEYV
jgi:hypothetical protein